MKQLLSNSFVYTLIHTLYESMKGLFTRIKDSAVKIKKGSVLEKLCNLLILFLDKETTIENALFYQFMSWFGSILKKAAIGLNSFLKLPLKNSLTWKLIKESDTSFRQSAYVLFGLVLTGSCVGYFIATLLKGAFDNHSILVMIVLSLAAAILFLAKDKLQHLICGSITYRVMIVAVKSILP